jgi:hypothetical protein
MESLSAQVQEMTLQKDVVLSEVQETSPSKDILTEHSSEIKNGVQVIIIQ